MDLFFQNRIQSNITDIILGANKDETKILFSKLYDFEKKINFKGNLSIGHSIINYFILQKKL